MAEVDGSRQPNRASDHSQGNDSIAGVGVTSFLRCVFFQSTVNPTSSTTLHPALFLVGDSTMQTGSGNGEKGPWGWGSEIISLFDPAKIQVYNAGRGGSSSRGYIEEAPGRNSWSACNPATS